MPLRAIVIDPRDNVANLIGPGRKGQQVECVVEGQQQTITVELVDDIPPNHKLAIADVAPGQPVIKYGFPIGRATVAIAKGQHVHVHNIESTRGRGDLQSNSSPAEAGRQ